MTDIIELPSAQVQLNLPTRAELGNNETESGVAVLVMGSVLDQALVRNAVGSY